MKSKIEAILYCKYSITRVLKIKAGINFLSIKDKDRQRNKRIFSGDRLDQVEIFLSTL